MKLACVLSLFIFMMFCNDKKNANTNITIENIFIETIDSCENYESILKDYAAAFTPSTVGLNNSISQSLNFFLSDIETDCLRKQDNYEEFIITILAKMAVYHLRCCNQGYDLFQMDGHAAKFIISEFLHFSEYSPQKLEMLQSGIVIDYILGDSTLSKNKTLNSLTKEYKQEKKIF